MWNEMQKKQVTFCRLILEIIKCNQAPSSGWSRASYKMPKSYSSESQMESSLLFWKKSKSTSSKNIYPWFVAKSFLSIIKTNKQTEIEFAAKTQNEQEKTQICRKQGWTNFLTGGPQQILKSDWGAAPGAEGSGIFLSHLIGGKNITLDM